MKKTSEIPFGSAVAIADLRPHPANYRRHPAAQIAHLAASIKRHGCYRNIVITEDGTILAGHGTVEAAKKAGLKMIPAITLKIKADSEAAKRIMVGDNKISEMGETDEKALGALLAEISSDGGNMLGTGISEQALEELLCPKEPVKLKPLKILPPPKMAWVLVGIPLPRYGEIEAEIERVSKTEGVFCETTINDQET